MLRPGSRQRLAVSQELLGQVAECLAWPDWQRIEDVVVPLVEQLMVGEDEHGGWTVNRPLEMSEAEAVLELMAACIGIHHHPINEAWAAVPAQDTYPGPGMMRLLANRNLILYCTRMAPDLCALLEDDGLPWWVQDRAIEGLRWFLDQPGAQSAMQRAVTRSNEQVARSAQIALSHWTNCRACGAYSTRFPPSGGCHQCGMDPWTGQVPM